MIKNLNEMVNDILLVINVGINKLPLSERLYLYYSNFLIGSINYLTIL